MKQLMLAAVAAALFTSMPTVAQQQPPAKTVPGQTTTDAQTFDKQLAEAQAQMKRMQEQMERVRQTQDPQERQRLLQEHWTAMQATMSAMHGMWGPGAMGCCGGPGMMAGSGMMGGPGMMHGPGMRQFYGQLTPEQLKQRQYMTDQYMGMHHMMMDHMLQHQQWMQAPPTR